MVSADEFVQRMEKLQAAKGEAFKPLAEILGERAAIQQEMAKMVAGFEEQLANLDEPYGKAYVAAEKAGWTTSELTELGADEPVRRSRGRRSGKSTTAKKTAAVTETGAPETVTAAVPAPTQGDATDAAATAGFPSS
jgi:hypothetical protein